MVKKTWLVLLSALLVNTCFAKDVTFVTLNTFWLFNDIAPHKKWWDDQRGDMGQTYDQALTLVAEAIRKTNGDVVALQEVENASVVSDLNAKLAAMSAGYDYTWTGKGSDSKTGQDVALFSKFPKANDGELIRGYPKEREYYLTEADPGNEAHTGLSKSLRVDLNIDGETIPVWVFHLKSQRGGSASDKQRQAQASLVRRITLPLIQNNRKFIVMGDMNADRGSSTLRRIRGFDDIYADLVQPVHDNAFAGDKWTYRYRGRMQQIDHILLSPQLRKSIKSGLIQYGHDKHTTDHYPVIVKVDI